MAYTKAPTVDTYSAERINLFREMADRDGGDSGKDEDYLNVLIEPVRQSKLNDTRRFILKRAGTKQEIASVASGDVRGMYFWADQAKLFYCVGRNVYIYNINTGVSTTLTNAFTTSSGTVGFCEYLYDTGNVVICGTDGTATVGLITIDSANTVTTCADADLPTHLPYPVFLDGYLFLAKANSADVYNSDLNNPLSWTTTGVISAEMEADLVVRIAKINNYLLVFGKESIEYFWDAAEPAPGSPLLRNDTPIKINSYLGGYSSYGNIVYYIGQDAGGQPDIFRLKDFKIESIGTPTISRYLDSATDGIVNWTGNIVSLQGHTFYIITAGTTKTFVGDVDQNVWMRWAFQNNNTFDITKTVIGTSTINTKTFFTIAGNNATIYSFDKSLYQDVGVNFTCLITTENNDFGTLNRKTMSRCSVLGDRPPSNANLLIQWSDDDYQTYNTGQYVNLNQDSASIYRLGSFRQRVFKLSYNENAPLRIQELEVNINKGAT